MNITGALVYLLDIIFSVYITAILIRVILQYVRAPFYNPIIQFITQITNPGFKIFRKFIPGFKGIDFAGIVFAYLLAILNILLIYFLKLGFIPNLLAIMFSAFFLLIDSVLSILKWTIILTIIFSLISLFAPHASHAFGQISYLTHLISEPILRPIRRVMPPLGGFDLSPIVALIGISLIRILFGII